MKWSLSIYILFQIEYLKFLKFNYLFNFGSITIVYWRMLQKFGLHRDVPYYNVHLRWNFPNNIQAYIVTHIIFLHSNFKNLTIFSNFHPKTEIFIRYI